MAGQSLLRPFEEAALVAGGPFCAFVVGRPLPSSSAAGDDARRFGVERDLGIDVTGPHLTWTSRRVPSKGRAGAGGLAHLFAKQQTIIVTFIELRHTTDAGCHVDFTIDAGTPKGCWPSQPRGQHLLSECRLAGAAQH